MSGPPMSAPRARTRALRIGLVGPVGCGKSTVASWLGEGGAVVIDADRLARTVLNPGEPALAAVLATFGDRLRLADGSLDRSALAAIVFADPEALGRLEAIVHPAVRPLIVAAIEGAETHGAATVVLEAIRLVDGSYGPLMDEIWLVTCSGEVQRERLALRGIEGEDAERRIGAQAELVDRAAAAATRVIDTSGSPADTRAAVDRALDTAREARERRGAPGDP